jgi:hypothetical protein
LVVAEVLCVQSCIEFDWRVVESLLVLRIVSAKSLALIGNPDIFVTNL